MNRFALMLAAALIAGCSQYAEPDRAPVSAADLQNHRFELIAVDGKPVSTGGEPQPELLFNDGMRISGSMCNRFFGQATLENNRLTAQNLASTRMLCADQQRNQWDLLVADMLRQGAQLRLSQRELTLSTAQHALTYRQTDAQ